MFDDLIREIDRLGTGMEVGVSIPPDEEGYAERECPNPECLARFKVQDEDWATFVQEEAAYCPVCRHEADSESWWTTDQIEYARQVAFQQVKDRFDQAMRRGVQGANRRAPMGGLISFSFSYEPGHRQYVAPLAAGEVLEQRSACEACGCRYASVGAAFFCPACGHNSARSMFADTIANVRRGLDLIPRLTEMLDRDQAADLGRGITENAMVKLVTAFQRYAEATYDALPDPKAAPGFNAFQRLADGSSLFLGAAGRGYDTILSATELAELGRYFQQRHTLVHDDGIVNQRYIDRSGDASYRVGQRLVIKPSAVRRAADLVERLAQGLPPTSP